MRERESAIALGPIKKVLGAFLGRFVICYRNDTTCLTKSLFS